MNKLKKYQMFINGEWIDSENNKTFETLNPENNEPWAVVPEASANDVDKAVNAAQTAFSGEWGRKTALERGRILLKIGEAVLSNVDTLAKIEAQDVGKPLSQALT